MKTVATLSVALGVAYQSSCGTQASLCDKSGERPVRVKGVSGSFCVPRQQCDGFLSGTNGKPLFCPRSGQRNVDGSVTLAQDSCCAVVDSIRGTLGCVQKEHNSQTACLLPIQQPREQDYVRIGRKRGRSRTLKSDVTSEAIFTIPVSLREAVTPTMNSAAAKSAILAKAAQTIAPVIPAMSNASVISSQIPVAASIDSEVTPRVFVETNDVLQDEEVIAPAAGPSIDDCANLTVSGNDTAQAPVIAHERPASVLGEEISKKPISELFVDIAANNRYFGKFDKGINCYDRSDFSCKTIFRWRSCSNSSH